MEDQIKNFAVNTAGAVLWHPFTFSRTLMQLGYEPEAPQYCNTVLASLKLGSQKTWYYKNVFNYIGRLRDEVGWFGVFTIGLPARLVAGVICTSVARRTRLLMEPEEVGENAEERARKRRSGDETEYEFAVHTTYAAVSRTAGVVVSYPLYVVMVRQMAYLGGGSEAYNTLRGTIQEIYNSDGIRGFFSGVLPKAFAEFVTVIVSASLAYLVNKYLLNKTAPDAKELTHLATGMVASTLTYKYNVLACVMAVDNTKLDLGMKFGDSCEAFRYLKERHMFSRGASLFFRRAPPDAIPHGHGDPGIMF